MSGIIRQILQALSTIPGLGDARSRMIVVACGVICAVAAGAWATIFPGNWQASQSMVVRDDLLGDSFKPGKFNSIESMKSAQETIFHIARKPEVIRAAVHASGQTGDLSSEGVEKYQRWISIVAPNGGEFGKTEVFVVRVSEKSPERAEQLINALSSEIELHLRVVRTNLMASMQNELTSNVARTSEHYGELVREIQKVEQSVGADLATLRGLIDPNAGAGDLQRSLEQIRLEIRAATNDRERVAKQLELVRLAMQQTSGEYLTTSNELLELQPALKRLNDGLVDARLALSVAMGKYDTGHPVVENAKAAASQTLGQIRIVLDSTELGLESQLGLYDQKVTRLSGDEQASVKRLIDIGKLRVTYKSLSDELTKRGEALAKTRTELAEIQALAESAGDVSLITRIGGPQLGTRPDGMSKRAMVLAGFIGGLMIGLGLTVLMSGPVKLPTLSMVSPAFNQANQRAPAVRDVSAATKREPEKQQSPPPKPVPTIESLVPKFEQALGKWSNKPTKGPRPVAGTSSEQPSKVPASVPQQVVVKPVAPQPVATKPVVAQPVVAQPVVAQPVVAQPVAPLPIAAQPVVPTLVMKADPLRALPVQRAASGNFGQPEEPEKPRTISAYLNARTAAVPPAPLPAPLVPNPVGRPGQFLKTVDSGDTDGRRDAKLGTAESIVKSEGLTSEDIGKLIPPLSKPLDRGSVPNSPPMPARPQSSYASKSTGEQKSGLRQGVSTDTSSGIGTGNNQTVSMADLQIQRIRQQLEELDPSISFDVFCQDVRKDSPPPARNP